MSIYKMSCETGAVFNLQTKAIKVVKLLFQFQM